jgi:hypothetical protein
MDAIWGRAYYQTAGRRASETLVFRAETRGSRAYGVAATVNPAICAKPLPSQLP